MRNVFDQYSQPENRLTHALAVALFEDKSLLRAFVRFATGKAASSGRLEVVEQRLPGSGDVGELEARGLPDMCIYDDSGWCLIVESKVAADLDAGQLRRHMRTMERRDFKSIRALALDVVSPGRELPQGCEFRLWSELYQWLIRQSGRSRWAKRVANFMEIVEARWPEEGYLKDGTLTVFAGIPFGGEDDYNYPEARRMIKLAMPVLRQNKRLNRELGIDQSRGGRGAITGKQGSAVWDFLRLREPLGGNKAFTAYPHLTLAIERDRVLAIVVIPHGIIPAFRRNLVDLGQRGFIDLLSEVNRLMTKALRKAKGSAPWLIVSQRRWRSLRSRAVVDANIEFDLRTAFPEKSGAGNRVKLQPQWLEATYDALAGKRSNLQVAVGASFPYRECAVSQKAELLEFVAEAWIACKPLFEVMKAGRSHHGRG